jgi:hypothetical protein
MLAGMILQGVAAFGNGSDSPCSMAHAGKDDLQISSCVHRISTATRRVMTVNLPSRKFRRHYP